MDKPNALAKICDGLEKRGLYTPDAPLTLSEYNELTARACTLATTGNLESAEHITATRDRHAPDFIRALKTAHV